MQYLKYPTKTMNITQTYNGTTSHKLAAIGKPSSYPIDDNCGTSGRSEFYAPCDLTIKRIYGVGNAGINTIWLESINPVMLANGNTSYVTMLIMHVDDDDLRNLKVGQTFTQGEYLFREGRDGYDRGYATGYHFHIEVSTSKFNELGNNGWVKNSKGVWVISRNGIKPEDAFSIDSTFTTIKGKGNLNWKNLSESPIPPIDTPLKVGDRVEIIGTGNSQANGKGKRASGKGYKREIIRIYEGSAYPYRVGNSSGTTGYYEASSLKKI